MVIVTDAQRRVIRNEVPLWVVYPPEKIDKDKIIADQQKMIERLLAGCDAAGFSTEDT